MVVFQCLVLERVSLVSLHRGAGGTYSALGIGGRIARQGYFEGKESGSCRTAHLRWILPSGKWAESRSVVQEQPQILLMMEESMSMTADCSSSVVGMERLG